MLSLKQETSTRDRFSVIKVRRSVTKSVRDYSTTGLLPKFRDQIYDRMWQIIKPIHFFKKN